jgi:hypothetical protein
MVFEVKSEGKGPLGRTICDCEDSIKMDLTEIGWDAMDRADLAQDRDKWREYENEISSSIKRWEILTVLGHWRVFQGHSTMQLANV